MFQTEIQTGLVTGDHIPLLSLLLFISSVDLVWKEESLGWEDLLLHLPLLQALLWSRWKLCKSWRKLSWPRSFALSSTLQWILSQLERTRVIKNSHLSIFFFFFSLFSVLQSIFSRLGGNWMSLSSLPKSQTIVGELSTGSMLFTRTCLSPRFSSLIGSPLTMSHTTRYPY